MTKVLHNNEMTGKGKDHNILVIQVAGLQNILLNRPYHQQEITPFLNQWSKKSGTQYFSQYFQVVGLGDFSDSEFVSLHSLYPGKDQMSYEKYQLTDLYGLPKIAGDKKYSTWAFHPYDRNFFKGTNTYEHLGFQHQFFLDRLDPKEKINGRISDSSYWSQILPFLEKANKEGKFFAFVETSTSKPPFQLPKHLATLQLQEKDQGSLWGNYLQSIHYMDRCLGDFIKVLESKGILNNTMVIIYGDRFALPTIDPETQEKLKGFLGREYRYEDMLNMPLLIHLPKEGENKNNSQVGSFPDLMPTVLNIMGWNDVVSPMFGRDLFNGEKGKVYFVKDLPEGSYLTEDVLYQVGEKGTKDQVFHRKERRLSPPSEESKEKEKALQTIAQSRALLDNNKVQAWRQEEYRRRLGNLDQLRKIMHAGGSLGDMTYTNMKEALDKHYQRGRRYFEVDFEKTADGEFVALHSWDGFITKFFGKAYKNVAYDHKDFQAFTSVHGYTPLDLKGVIQWMKNHKDAYLITDCKKDNILFLKKLKEKAPEIVPRVLPQMYFTKEYEEIKGLGYEGIIWTLYRGNFTEQEVLDFAKAHPLYGITMEEKYYDQGLGKRLIEAGHPVYVHTINDYQKAKRMMDQGVQGIYTDEL